MRAVDCPCVAGIEESGHDYSFIDVQLCLEIVSVSFHTFLLILAKGVHALAILHQLVGDKHISGRGTAEICEIVYSLQLLALDYEDWN